MGHASSVSGEKCRYAKSEDPVAFRTTDMMQCSHFHAKYEETYQQYMKTQCESGSGGLPGRFLTRRYSHAISTSKQEETRLGDQQDAPTFSGQMENDLSLLTPSSTGVERPPSLTIHHSPISTGNSVSANTLSNVCTTTDEGDIILLGRRDNTFWVWECLFGSNWNLLETRWDRGCWLTFAKDDHLLHHYFHNHGLVRLGRHPLLHVCKQCGTFVEPQTLVCLCKGPRIEPLERRLYGLRPAIEAASIGG